MATSDRRVCLDLFAGLGGFSQAFTESDDWRVVTVELEERFEPDICADVMNLRPSDLPNADVVLASPPCTLFSPAGNHDEWDLDARIPTGDRAREHVALVHHTIGLIQALTPRYWYVENPRGRMRWVLGDPAGTVHYCQYGKDYLKPTDLWGEHPDGFTYRQCPVPAGGGCHTRNGADDGTGATASMSTDHAERSKVPYELSAAILDAVEGRGEQATLTTF
jgi:hypothetical protein